MEILQKPQGRESGYTQVSDPWILEIWRIGLRKKGGVTHLGVVGDPPMSLGGWKPIHMEHKTERSEADSDALQIHLEHLSEALGG